MTTGKAFESSLTVCGTLTPVRAECAQHREHVSKCPISEDRRNRVQAAVYPEQKVNYSFIRENARFSNGGAET